MNPVPDALRKPGAPGLDFETWETTNPSGRVVPEMLGAPPSPRPSPPQRRRPVAGDPGFHPSDEDRSLGTPVSTPATKTGRWGPRFAARFSLHPQEFFLFLGVSRGELSLFGFPCGSAVEGAGKSLFPSQGIRLRKMRWGWWLRAEAESPNSNAGWGIPRILSFWLCKGKA